MQQQAHVIAQRLLNIYRQEHVLVGGWAAVNRVLIDESNDPNVIAELNKYKYVVICSYYEGRYMLSRHSKRTTWETQGGHIEVGETPMDAIDPE